MVNNNLVFNKCERNNRFIKFCQILNVWRFEAFFSSVTIGAMHFHLGWLGIKILEMQYSELKI